MRLEIEIQGEQKLIRSAEALSRAREELKERISKEAQDFANAALTTIKEKYLTGGTGHLKVGTGRLRSSMRYLVAEAEGNVVVTFGSDVPYAAIHEFGGDTRPHEIRPKRKKALRFLTPGWGGAVRRTKSGKLARSQTDGAITFAQVVHHPGSHIPARPFLTPGVEDTLPMLTTGIEQALLDIAHTGFSDGE